MEQARLGQIRSEQYQRVSLNIPFLTTNKPNGPLTQFFMNECRLERSTRGGCSHSSTYGCQKSDPFPRDATVWSQARSLAIPMFRLRKNLMMCVTCDPTNITAASTNECKCKGSASEWQNGLTCVDIEGNTEAKHGVRREARNTRRTGIR